MDLSAGKDFDFVFVSVNPAEDYRLASLKRQSYLIEYGRKDNGRWISFPRRPANDAIHGRLTNAVGYLYSHK